MRSGDVSWRFARRPKQDEFEDLDGSFGPGFEEDADGEASDARGEGIWKSYAEDLDIEE